MPHYTAIGGHRFAAGQSSSFQSLDFWFGHPNLERLYIPSLFGQSLFRRSLFNTGAITQSFFEQFDGATSWQDLQGTPQNVVRSVSNPIPSVFFNQECMFITTQTVQFSATEMTCCILVQTTPSGPAQQTIYCYYNNFAIVQMVWLPSTSEIQMLVTDEDDNPVPGPKWAVPPGKHVFRFTLGNDSSGTTIDVAINGTPCAPPFVIVPPLQPFDSAGPQIIIGGPSPASGDFIGDLYAFAQYARVLSGPEIALVEGRLFELQALIP